MKFSFLLSFVFTLTNVYSQNFEGKITYANRFTSKMEGVSDKFLEALIGEKQEYFIKDGSYKSVLNGQSITMQIYDCKTNRIYSKTPKSDTAYWFDASINTDMAVSFEIKKNVESILGNACDVIIMKTKTGTTTIFYSSLYRVDWKLFENHHYSNWAYYLERTQALPLKTIVETGSFRMESTATEIKPVKLGSENFEIDPIVPIKKS